MRGFIKIVENVTEPLITHSIADMIANGEHEGYNPYWKLIADAKILSDTDAMAHISSHVHDGVTSGIHPFWELKVIESRDHDDDEIHAEKILDEEIIDVVHNHMLVPVAETNGRGQGWYEVSSNLATMWVVEDQDGIPVFSDASRDVAAAKLAELEHETELHEPILDEDVLLPQNQFSDQADFVVTLNAVHERGERQEAALAELEHRGIALTPEQRVEAGLTR